MAIAIPPYPEPGPLLAKNTPGHELATVMSLREWYAGMVIQGISASCACLRTMDEVASFSTRMAAIAFVIADAMLAEAAKAEPPQ